MQSRHWVFTVNNWTSADEQRLIALSQTADYLVFGYEEAASGTRHLQGYIIFNKKKRFTEAKTYLPEGVHLEVKRGSAKQAADYCKKDGVFKEYGIVPSSGGNGGAFARFTEWVTEHYNVHGRAPNDREIARQFPGLFVRYSRKLKELATHTLPPPMLQDGTELRTWQLELENLLLCEPNDRSIMFYVDREGGKGKSWFMRYLITAYPDRVQLLSVGKRDDIAHAVDESKDIFLFSVPRNGMQFFNYTSIEQIKDRVVFSPKYDSSTKVLTKVPHVVVFSNEMPDLTALTEDRFHIVEDF